MTDPVVPVDHTDAPHIDPPRPAYTTSSPAPKPSPRPPQKKTREMDDPDLFIEMAKTMVVNNYNQHIDKEISRPLPPNGVHVMWFAKTLGNWTAMIGSTIVRGLIWEVTSNVYKREVYINVYKKLNNVKVIMPDTRGENA